MSFRPRASHQQIADTLNSAAARMDTGQDPDGAVRAAIWGTDKVSPIPDGTSDGLLYDEASAAIEGHWANARGYDCGNGLDDIPPAEAAESARARAADFRRAGGRQ
ncbi:hypothetical protein OG742_37235 [Streptomyces sp. NBC_00828]|uniref:hypothetical protein n=1 Tax=Streptomyces sp. NBC_00828 TaxID=2903678 RepID=UPI00386DE836